MKKKRKRRQRGSRARSRRTKTLSDIAAVFESYDRADLLAGLAALQLLPGNADRLLRLETAVQLAASLPTSEGASITRAKLISILGSPPFSSWEIGSQEDPYPALFVDCLTLPSGNWLVFSGIAEGHVFIVEHIGLALWHIDEISTKPWAGDARDLITAALRLSDAIADRAGLQRGTRAGEARVHPAAPDQTTYEILQAAVVFSGDELEALVGDLGQPWTLLDPLTTSPGEYNYDGGLQTFCGRPFFRCDDALVVHLPHLVLVGLRHAVITRAIEEGDGDNLASSYFASVWDSACRALIHLGHPYERALDVPSLRDSTQRAAVFSMDTDKRLCALLATDGLGAYSRQSTFQDISGEQYGEAMDAVIAECEQQLYVDGIIDVLFVIIYQGVGRDAALGLSREPLGKTLLLSADELQVVSWTSKPDALCLWRFAHQEDEARRRGLVATSTLDTFAFYRRHKDGFYFNDDAPPGPVFVPPGFGRELRERLVEVCDWHGAFRPGDHECQKLVSWQARASEWPLYTPHLSIGTQVCILVEGLVAPIWVFGTRVEGEALYRHYAVLAETVAYWLWQLGDHLAPFLDANGTYTVWLYLQPEDAWNSGFLADQHTIPTVDVRTRTAEWSMCLFVNASLANVAIRGDNLADRSIVSALLGGLARLGASPPCSRESLDAIVDDVAPLGNKKHFIVYDERAPDVDSSGLPTARLVSDAAEHAVRDWLGTELHAAGLSRWPAPATQRSDLLNNAVGIAFARFEQAIAALSPEGLHEYLLLQDEAKVRDMRYAERTLAFKGACYGTDSRHVRELANEQSSIAEAAIASRFLIEYVSAQPPCGIRSISATFYDELMALAATISNVGTESDLLRMGIADFDVGVLPSGRLGVDRSAYQQARRDYLYALSGDILERATQPEGGSPNGPNRLKGITSAWVAEFGTSFERARDAMGVCLKRATQSPTRVARVRRSHLVQAIAKDTQLSAEDADRLLTRLSLAKRDSFLKPAAPFRQDDVYPWRFNRALSYLRKPFIQLGDDQLIFGMRHLIGSRAYLLDLCLSGRLKAQSREMRRAISAARSETTKRFNDDVADALVTVGHLVVRRRLKKANGQHIADAGGNDLGDIDVLVANPARRRLIAIECKALCISRTPRELTNQLDELFVGKRNESSVETKHLRRVDWLRAHLQDVLAELELDGNTGWGIEPVFVFDRPLMAAHVARAKMRCLSVDGAVSHAG